MENAETFRSLQRLDVVDSLAVVLGIHHTTSTYLHWVLRRMVLHPIRCCAKLRAEQPKIPSAQTPLEDDLWKQSPGFARTVGGWRVQQNSQDLPKPKVDQFPGGFP